MLHDYFKPQISSGKLHCNKISNPNSPIGESKKNQRLKDHCSLNIKEIILKIFLFYCQYVELDSVIYPALIGISFPCTWKILRRNPLPQPAKTCEMSMTSFLKRLTLIRIHYFVPFWRILLPWRIEPPSYQGKTCFSSQEDSAC